MPQACSLRHLSIRVPWHDTAWDGRVCASPHLNGACLKLKRIAEDKDDAAEKAIAGKLLSEIPQAQWPCCIDERMTFMAPFEFTKTKNHPYNRDTEGIITRDEANGSIDSSKINELIDQVLNP